MTPAHARKVLPIYRENLKQYEGEKAETQRRLIARLEKDAEG